MRFKSFINITVARKMIIHFEEHLQRKMVLLQPKKKTKTMLVVLNQKIVKKHLFATVENSLNQSITKFRMSKRSK